MPHTAPSFSVGFSCFRNALAPAILMAVVWFASPVSAQQYDGLDDVKFIQGLRERGMIKLLKHFVQTNPPKDGVLSLEIQIEVAKAQFADEDEQVAVRYEAPLNAMKLYRELLATSPADHWKRPIWRTDMSMYGLEVVLSSRFAFTDLFVEYGITTQQQRQDFDKLVPELYEQMQLAAGEFLQLQNNLPRRKDFEPEYVNTGRWGLINKTYGMMQMPYVQAWATYYNTLTAANPRGNLQEAYGQLQMAVEQELSPAGKAQVLNLTGRVLLGQGRSAAAPAEEAAPAAAAPAAKGKKSAAPAGKGNAAAGGAGKDAGKALSYFDQALAAIAELNAEEHPYVHSIRFAINLGKSEAMHRQGQTAAALNMLEQMGNQEPVVSDKSRLLLVLTHDRMIRIAGDAKKDEIFKKLFDHPHAAQQRNAIQRYISDREGAGKEVDPKTARPFEVFSKVDVLGQDALAKKDQIKNETDDAKKKELADEAQKILTEAGELLRVFLERQDLGEADKGRARIKLAEIDITVGKPLEAAKSFLAAAKESADAEAGRVAGKNAYIAAKILYADPGLKDNPVYGELFLETMEVLSSKYPDYDFTQREVPYSLGAYLFNQRRYEEAVESLKKVTSKHSNYLDARYQIVVARHNKWLNAVPDQKRQTAQAVLDEANATLKAFEEGMRSTSGERKTRLRHNQGDTLLMRSEVLVELDRHVEARQPIGDSFETNYAQFPDLQNARRRLIIGILIHVSDVEKLKTEVQNLAIGDPKNAGAIIKGVLDQLSRKVTELELTNQKDKAQALGKIGVDISKVLLEWAKKQNLNTVPFEIYVGEQLLVAKQFDEAMQLYDRLDKENPNTQEVIRARMEAHFALGNYDQAREVAAHIDTILSQPTVQPKPPLLWKARVILMQCYDKKYDELQAADAGKARKWSRGVVSMVGIYRNQDINLGGGVYQVELVRLENKHKAMAAGN